MHKNRYVLYIHKKNNITNMIKLFFSIYYNYYFPGLSKSRDKWSKYKPLLILFTIYGRKLLKKKT